jgi:hypothetical protein
MVTMMMMMMMMMMILPQIHCNALYIGTFLHGEEELVAVN